MCGLLMQGYLKLLQHSDKFEQVFLGQLYTKLLVC